MQKGSLGRFIVVALTGALFALIVTAAIGPSSAGAATYTFNPAADARTKEASPSTNYGTDNYLTTKGGTSGRYRTYLRFDVSGVSGTVVSAKVRLRSEDGSNGETTNGPAVYTTDGTWAETGITWSNQPAPSDTALSDAGAVAPGTWTEWDVASAVSGNGTVNFVLTPSESETDVVYFNSRESSGTTNDPQLVVTTAECSDAVDNDGDGKIDYPADPDCTSASDPTESPDPGPFVRGIWTESTAPQTEFDKVRSLGFQYAQVDPDLAQLDRVQAAGLKAIVWLGNYDDGNCVWNWSDQKVTEKINATKAHPAIAYYFIADEPHSGASGGCESAPQQLRDREALVNSLDPGVPTALSENRTADYANLAGITDVFIAIAYPCSYTYGCMRSKISKKIDAINAAGITHWWGAAQSFKEPEEGYYRAPSPSELQQTFQTWKADPGIDGFYGYTWGNGCCGDDIGLSELPGLWDTWKAENGV